MKFDVANAIPEQKVYDEIYAPIIEKQKTIDPSERSVYQLLEQYVEGEKTILLLTELQQKLTQPCYRKYFFQCIQNISHLL